MKSFEYAEPQTEAEAVALLADNTATEVLAGGTDLVGLMKKMIVKPNLVVNIMEIPTLQNIEQQQDGTVTIGAAVTLDEVLAHPYLTPYQAITDAILGINSMQLQAQGTLGGEICQRPRCWFYRNGGELFDDAQVLQGDNRYHAILGNQGPAKYVSSSRIAPALIALGAQLRVVGPQTTEEVLPAADFFRSPEYAGQRETVLGEDRLLTHIILPDIAGRISGTYEVRHSEGPDFPMTAAAAALGLDTEGIVLDAQIVMGQVAPLPWISYEAAQVLVGRSVTEQSATQAGHAAVAQATPLSENEYKVQQAMVAVKRSILRAAGLETGGF
ncbi:MAG: FAD binding domain-containing protein [Pseudomonadales bacterium]|nr:FAD binding domain-containing protein [Pseudomonadales bacterium]